MTVFHDPAGQLYLGDCIEVMRRLPDGCVDLVVTDPAYKVISGGNSSPASTANYGWKSSVLAANDGKIFKHNAIKFADYVPELFRILKPGTHCYIMVNRINLRDLLNVADAAGFELHNLLRWDKGSVNANRWYMIDCEMTLFFYKPPAKSINNPGSKQTFSCRNIPGKDRAHPTEKPIELMRHYIENSSQPGDIVFDPFAGCGTTLVAAKQSGRRFIGVEIDPQYYVASMVRLLSA